MTSRSAYFSANQIATASLMEAEGTRVRRFRRLWRGERPLGWFRLTARERASAAAARHLNKCLDSGTTPSAAGLREAIDADMADATFGDPGDEEVGTIWMSLLVTIIVKVAMYLWEQRHA